MKPGSSQRQKKPLRLLIALSAIFLLASLSLLIKTVLSFSNTSTEVRQEKPMLQELETAEPQRPTVAQSEETVPEPTQSQHLSLQAFEAALSEYTPAYGDPASLQHGILCSNDMVERDGWLYFFFIDYRRGWARTNRTLRLSRGRRYDHLPAYTQ